MSQQIRDHARRETELAVSGMTCGSCAARVQKVLARQEGVEEAAVNFATGRATVVFVRVRPGEKIPVDAEVIDGHSIGCPPTARPRCSSPSTAPQRA